MPDPYDVLTIAAVVDELSHTLENGRIQRIGLIDNRTIGAEIYARGHRHHLLASADDRLPRLRLASDMPSLDTALTTPFGLLLRKYLRGGVILGIDQPPLERLVRFSIARRLAPLKTAASHDKYAAVLATDGEQFGDDDDGETPEEDEDAPLTFVSLYVELMGRHSNLILVDDDGVIMESVKRVTPAMSRVRTVLPRQPYIPPPPPDRLDPGAIDQTTAERLLDSLQDDKDLARQIVATFRGVSPLMAREIAFRMAEPNADLPAESGARAMSLIRVMRELLDPLETRRWSPRLYREHGDQGAGAVAAFAPLPMEHLAARYAEESVVSISEAAALAESVTQAPSPMRHAQRRQRLLAHVNAARGKAERRVVALASEAARAANVERLREAGEAIYAHLWEIAPGQSELMIDGERIALDPALTPNENAQAYFERYRKAQSAERQLPGLEAESQAEIDYLDQLATLIAQAPGFSELEALAAEWTEHATPVEVKRPKRKAAPRRPKALTDNQGNSVYIGRSGPQNDLLTFEIAGPDDTWLHARGVGGSHVIVRWRAPGDPEIPETLEAAASLAAWYSAARESGAVEVDVARRRYVRKIKGGGPGMVTYRNEKTVRVRPAPEEQLTGILNER